MFFVEIAKVTYLAARKGEKSTGKPKRSENILHFGRKSAILYMEK